MITLTKEVKGQVAIARVLDEQDSWITSEKIAQLCQLNAGTVQKYTQVLQKLLLQHFDQNEIAISKNRNHGIRLFRDPRFNFQHLLTKILHQDLDTQIIDTLIAQGYLNSEEFCRQHHISRSTLKRNLTQLRQHLANYGLSLTQGSKIQLTGSELQIRYYLFQYLWILYRSLQLAPWDQSASLAFQAKQVTSLFKKKFSPVQQAELTIILFLFQQRVRQHQQLKEDLLEKVPASLTKPSLFYEWSDQDWQFFLICLSCFPVFTGLTDEDSRFQILFAEFQSDYQQLKNFWWQAFSKNFPLSEAQRTIAKPQLFRVFIFLKYFQEVYGIIQITSLVDEKKIQQLAPAFMKKFEKSFLDFQAVYSKNNPQMLRLSSLLILNQLHSYRLYKKEVTLALVTDFGLPYEYHLKDQLTDALSRKYQVNYINDLQAADVVLSNIPIPWQENMIRIRTPLNPRDLTLIFQKLAKKNDIA